MKRAFTDENKMAIERIFYEKTGLKRERAAARFGRRPGTRWVYAAALCCLILLGGVAGEQFLVNGLADGARSGFTEMPMAAAPEEAPMETAAAAEDAAEMPMADDYKYGLAVEEAETDIADAGPVSLMMADKSKERAAEAESGGLGVSGSNAAIVREDVCALYVEVLEDLWNVDPGLNSGISQIGIDLSELSHLTEAEKDAVMSEFASKHDLPYVAGTFEELCQQGLIDKDDLCWKDGLFFSIKTNEDAAWNLPAIKDGGPVPELTSFDAQKWRSGLGAYFFDQCAAQKNADGTWSYTVGQEAIS